MTHNIILFVFLFFIHLSVQWSWNPDTKGPDGMPTGRPVNIAHRGASGMYPEHTTLAYQKAFQQNADYIECDVTITKVIKTYELI